MQFTINKTVKVLLTAAMLVTVSLSQVNAASASKTYTEDQFLNSFSGKTKKVISDKLGAPFKKEQ